jgi:hypothetical protein
MEQELNQLELKTRKSETSLANKRCKKHCRGTWQAAAPESSKNILEQGDSSGFVDAAGLQNPKRNGVSNLVLKATTQLTYEYWFIVWLYKQ